MDVRVVPPRLVLVGLLVCASAAADTLSRRVVRVVDWDTVVLLIAGHDQERIRLAGIDCPERKQVFGTRAKEALARLAAAKQVTVEWDKRDRYGRIVGKVIADGRDVNLVLVREGMCWWYRKYAHEQSGVDQSLYEDAEAKAREKRLGLWLDPRPVPPWEWRREQHGR
jgi:endonuclease YncB( thermonuclease family)